MCLFVFLFARSCSLSLLWICSVISSVCMHAYMWLVFLVLMFCGVVVSQIHSPNALACLSSLFPSSIASSRRLLHPSWYCNNVITKYISAFHFNILCFIEPLCSFYNHIVLSMFHFVVVCFHVSCLWILRLFWYIAIR